jgi:hypothetical protein
MLKNLIISLLLLFSIQLVAQNEELTPGALGLTALTPEMQLCDTNFHIFQYYNIGAKNEKSSQQILAEWAQFFKQPTGFKESGFLTVRFIVNCKGEPRVHKFYEMDLNYQKKTFPDTLKTQIWAFVQQLGGFKKGIYKYKETNYEVNYYYYFIFKIRNGVFESVAP